ncbi:MAG: bacillithiol system redox-active protein YtxJ [Pyrinomonadaceae bacterium]|nr:bacillithiol system redox-active protein YtxJ [Pyrinomonadaceae bacterium]
MPAVFNEITSEQQLESLFKLSHEKPVVLFKHSDTCSISASVFQGVSNAEAEINMVVVQRARNISNLIADRTGIRHQSPQAIVIVHSKPVYSASHFDISSEDIENALKIK